MAINRGPWNALVDDDGSNLTGTIWNKDKIKTVILDPADAAYITPTYGSWNPVDASGAGLSFTIGGAFYAKVARVVHIWMNIVYPATSNGAGALIGGLPFPNNPAIEGGLFTTYGISRVYYIGKSTSTIYILNPTTGAVLTNAQLSGQAIVVGGHYLEP